ncbi:MAG: hypothetical protein LBQ67_06265 [Treponema sp.]|nr:hypothetical protein [Treponema sp.]
MLKLKNGIAVSPPGIFIIYLAASYLVFTAFYCVFPGQEPALPYFSLSWRLIRGCLGFLNHYPALAMSSLVVPFGLRAQESQKFNSFSPQFLNSLKPFIFTAIAASVLYAALFFLALPAARDYEADLRHQTRLYQLALEKAQEHADKDEWAETARMVAICDRIWPGSGGIEKLRNESVVRAERALLTPLHADRENGEADDANPPSLPGQKPINSTEALAMAKSALEDQRWYDAHWLATLAAKLAPQGAAEIAEADRLAALAWQGSASLEPTARETRAYRIYRLKRDGYEALLSDEWIRAYYIFLELQDLSPEDPDVENYFAMSETGARTEAFFADEIETAMGDIMTGALFSLPMDAVSAGTSPGSGIIPGGRIVMRVSSVSVFPDYAYSIENEIMAFDRDGRPAWRMEAPYAKLVPVYLDSGPRVAVLMRALDRTDKTRRWEPETQGMGYKAPESAQITLELTWDDFLLLSEIRRGPDFLSAGELRRAADRLGNRGYLGEVFEAELIQRFVRPIFLLPVFIFVIVAGWRFRSLERPRYLGIPMLGILPLVFGGVMHLYQESFANLGIWALISLGFSGAVLLFSAAALVLLILSLVVLAAQHGEPVDVTPSK